MKKGRNGFRRLEGPALGIHRPYAEAEDQSFRTFPTSDLFFLLISGLLIGRNEAKKTLDLKNFGPFFMKLPKLQEKCLAQYNTIQLRKLGKVNTT